ncbi:Activator of 90 kDa heat shock protein ATPase-like protein 1 [Trichoplax sp. H2]|uniref:Activator of Hsp90 ATPase AHSA1-like N-terminal domain-containing protein n=1 Tax=Trichoplax adhaerens TaxID=10228 RepID=B3S6F4_TRIAD|nr:hypothetical protein TRIADDRAFT_59786 [Trichoplax adhaerens]EDV21749.1 hypothetical protein TRIADDRAFT_59786 [Trichoplax adhaerens]RDD47495.1 Activator of 90 kDa heat shock protein ATPase-like protein 1 [Trichoplax sp. H2]|eukprot:XP_002115897.1 hypothetical protein TRIADDRAFT_59786 [Trichoplax adhaerens]
MAKWGQGDPRWIVEERDDATNVNNWHWSEKDASKWSKGIFEELFLDLKFETVEGNCITTKILSADGDATVSNRKAKLITLYDWQLKIEWKGKLKDDDDEINGKISIDNFGEEYDVDEIDITVTTQTRDEASKTLRNIVEKYGIVMIREKIREYIKKLKEEFSRGLILPTSGKSGSSSKTSPSHKPSSASSSNKTSSKPKDSTSTGSDTSSSKDKIDTMKLTMKDEFKTTAEELFMTLITEQRVSAFMRSESMVDSKEGGTFSLLDGNITGKFLELTPHSKIVQTWRFKSWPEGHFSKVTISITQEDDCTKLNLVQSGIPATDIDRTREGWKRYYWQSMKDTFGYGSRIY